jgi:hypothetical protein
MDRTAFPRVATIAAEVISAASSYDKFFRC